MPKPLLIYWDTCAWLGLINGEAERKRQLEIVYENAKKGHYELWTSALAVVETRRLAREKEDPKPLSAENLKVLEDLFRQSFIKPVPMTLDIAEHARSLFRTTPKLGKWQDAVHLATALRWNVPLMHTYDAEDLLHLSLSLSCRNGEKLLICYPDETTDGPLFAKKA